MQKGMTGKQILPAEILRKGHFAACRTVNKSKV
jgi:hypothetical protein